jgi:hypothetical protein
VTFGFFKHLGTGYNHTITIGPNTYSHVQLSTDVQRRMLRCLEALTAKGNCAAIVRSAFQERIPPILAAVIHQSIYLVAVLLDRRHSNSGNSE